MPENDMGDSCWGQNPYISMPEKIIWAILVGGKNRTMLITQGTHDHL